MCRQSHTFTIIVARILLTLTWDCRVGHVVATTPSRRLSGRISQPMKSLKSTVLTVAAGVLAMSAVAAGHVASADPATPTWSCEAELDAVRGVPQQIIDAWAANDGAAVVAVFAPDGDLVVGDGTHLVGRREITTYMTDAFETFLDGTNVTAPVKDARCIAPTVGVVHTLGGILLPARPRCHQSGREYRRSSSPRTLTAGRTSVG